MLRGTLGRGEEDTPLGEDGSLASDENGATTFADTSEELVFFEGSEVAFILAEGAEPELLRGGLRVFGWKTSVSADKDARTDGVEVRTADDHPDSFWVYTDENVSNFHASATSTLLPYLLEIILCDHDSGVARDTSHPQSHHLAQPARSYLLFVTSTHPHS